MTSEATRLYLDVRSVEEFAEHHLEGTRNIPIDTLAARLHELNVSKDTEIFAFCRSGRRSGLAMELLKAAGYQNVTNAGSIDHVKLT